MAVAYIFQVICDKLLNLRLFHVLPDKFSFNHFYLSALFFSFAFGSAFFVSALVFLSSTKISTCVLFIFLLLFLPKCQKFPALFAQALLIIRLDVFRPLNWAFALAESISFMNSLAAFTGYLPSPIFVLCPTPLLNLL